ncbi:MAG: hypothetical protein V7636_1363 [Actinomycetota bacterium]|jgi:hypothetical protein
MAFAVEVVIPGLTKSQYDELRAKVGWLDTPPDGGMAHVAWWDGEDCHGVDVWESEAAFAAFAENRLGPGMAAIGVTADVVPVFHPAHEVFLPKALTLT